MEFINNWYVISNIWLFSHRAYILKFNVDSIYCSVLFWRGTHFHLHLCVYLLLFYDKKVKINFWHHTQKYADGSQFDFDNSFYSFFRYISFNNKLWIVSCWWRCIKENICISLQRNRMLARHAHFSCFMWNNLFYCTYRLCFFLRTSLLQWNP